MKCEIHGAISRKKLVDALNKIDKLIGIPENTDVFVYDHKFNSAKAVHMYVKNPGELKKLNAEEQTSLSLAFDDKDVIILYIGQREKYVKRDEEAFIGLLMHEIMHVIQGRKGLDKQIEEDSKKALDAFVKNIKPNELHTYDSILRNASFVLKDIYANSELVKLGLGKYIIENYYDLYAENKKISRHVHYSSITKDALEDPKIVSYAVNYELDFMGVIIPAIFLLNSKQTGKVKAERLVNTIAKCYENNMTHIAEKFNEIIHYCVNHLEDSSEFRQSYFEKILSLTRKLKH